MKYWADVEFSPIVIEDIEAETREEAKEKLYEILKDYVAEIEDFGLYEDEENE